MPSEVSKEMKAPYSMSRETCALPTANMSLNGRNLNLKSPRYESPLDNQ